MKKFIFLIIFMIIVTGCKSEVEDSNSSILEEKNIEEVSVKEVEQDYIEEVIEDEFVIINADIQNIHNSFDRASAIISEAYQSQIFTVYGVEVDSEGREWYKISADHSEWISGEYCSILDIDSIVGTYEYENPNNTKNHNENHTLIFEVIDNFLVGRYYGTTDDFDEAREGYYVGYYVSELLDFRLEKNKISFDLNPKTSDMFEEKIPLEIKNSEEAINAGFINWQPGANITEPMKFSGYLGDNIITIDALNGEREMKKIVE